MIYRCWNTLIYCSYCTIIVIVGSIIIILCYLHCKVCLHMLILSIEHARQLLFLRDRNSELGRVSSCKMPRCKGIVGNRCSKCVSLHYPRAELLWGQGVMCYYLHKLQTTLKLKVISQYKLWAINLSWICLILFIIKACFERSSIFHNCTLLSYGNNLTTTPPPFN